MSPKKINICTVRYSDNLGDGAISECLKHIIGEIDNNLIVNEFDLAGRTEYSANNLKAKNKILKFIYKLPPFLGRVAFIMIWLFVIRKKVLPVWNSNIGDGSPLVFGGGQLLMDDTLNFPIKIYNLVKLASSKKCKIAFNAVGVSKKWSFMAKWLFRKALLNENIMHISVRDKQSYDNLLLHMGNHADEIKNKISITVDPAVYAKDVYKTSLKKEFVGLCVASPMALAANSSNPKDFEHNYILKFWNDLALDLINRGHKVALISNGSFEDNEFLQNVAGLLEQQIKDNEVVAYNRPLAPKTLVNHLSDMKIVIAHRLHANILSYSIGIPTIGLIWDDKMKGFADVANRRKYFIESSELSTKKVIDTLLEIESSDNIEPCDELKSIALNTAEIMMKKLLIN